MTHNCEFMRYEGDPPCDRPANLKHWTGHWACAEHADTWDRWLNDAEPGGGFTEQELEEFERHEANN
jgi:hypothetical protein